MRPCPILERFCMIRMQCRREVGFITFRYINLPSLHFTDEKSDLVQQHTVGAKQASAEVPDASGRNWRDCVM